MRRSRRFPGRRNFAFRPRQRLSDGETTDQDAVAHLPALLGIRRRVQPVLEAVPVSCRGTSAPRPGELNLIFGGDPPGGRGEHRRRNPAFALRKVDAAAQGLVDLGDGVADFGTHPHQLDGIAQDRRQLAAVRLRVPQKAACVFTPGDDRIQVFGDHRLQQGNQALRFAVHGSSSFRYQPFRISAIALHWISSPEFAEAVVCAWRLARGRVG